MLDLGRRVPTHPARQGKMKILEKGVSFGNWRGKPGKQYSFRVVIPEKP